MASLKIAKRLRAAYHIADRLLAEVDLDVLAGWNGHSPERGGEPARMAGGDADITRLGAIDPGKELAQHQLESMTEIRRDPAANGKRRRGRVMGLRWVAAVMARPTPVPPHQPTNIGTPAALRAALEASITLLPWRTADSRHPAPGESWHPA